MGAMANGMAAHGGVVPMAVTYLAFSDYERPAMRMAALMGLPVKFVFSHDSIGIGRNGPTHQPVEILASLRAMPNMLVLRPADAVEAAECWEIAFEHRSGPSTLVFARQALPHVRRMHTSANLSRRGAYVLAEADGGPREVTLLATGSEVALALAARDALQAAGTPTAVVSMPSWELFAAQDAGLPLERARRRHRAGGLRSRAALRLGPLARRARRLRRHDRLRRLRTGRGAIPALRHHARGHRRRGAPPARHPTRDRHRMSPPGRSEGTRTEVQSTKVPNEPSHRLPRPRDDRAADPRPAAVVRARADRARRDRAPTRWSSAWPARRSPSPTRRRSPRATLERLPALKLVAVAATGTDCVDKAACAARGVAVSNIRGYADQHGARAHLRADPRAAPQRRGLSRVGAGRALAAVGPVLLLRPSDPRPARLAAGHHRRGRARPARGRSRARLRHGADVRRAQGQERPGTAVHAVAGGARDERRHHAALAADRRRRAA